jgi:hypothetical protein
MRESVKVLIRHNRMWESPETRLEFEREHGFGPLPKLDSDEWNEWWLRGDLQRYHDQFYEWSRLRAQAEIERLTTTTKGPSR